MPYASIRAQKNKKMNQCTRETVFQQKVSVFRCPFLDAEKIDSDTRHLKTCDMEPATMITDLAHGLRVPCVGLFFFHAFP